MTTLTLTKLRLEYFFEISLDLLCVAGTDGYFRLTNPAFTSTLGYTPEELLSQPFLDLVHPDDVEDTLAELAKLGNGIDTVYFENRYRCKDGSWRWLAWTCPAASPDDGLLYAAARDITLEKRLQAELIEFASHDSLTGLTNRPVFLDELARAAARVQRSPHLTISVLFIDLDDFKPINDQFGHRTGDDALREIARRLTSCARADDVTARIGGDEFAVLHQGENTDPEAAAGRLLEAISQPLQLGDNQPQRVTASIGIATSSAADQADPEQLLHDADTAMYQAKTAGGNQHRSFRPGSE